MTRRITWPADPTYLDRVLDKFHVGEDELVEAGVLEIEDDGKYFVLKIPDRHVLEGSIRAKREAKR